MTDFVDGVALTAQELNDAFAGKADVGAGGGNGGGIQIVASGQYQFFLDPLITAGACMMLRSQGATGILSSDVLQWSFANDPSTNGVGALSIIGFSMNDWACFRVCNYTPVDIAPPENTLVTVNWQVLR
jgi:hypothetical protein